MFFHNFKYSLKILLKNRMLIFWTFAFPIILGTFFNMAFSNIENSEKFDCINIAIVETQEFNDNEIYKNAFKELSKNGDNKLFNIKYVDEEKAKELLDNEEISGYLIYNGSSKIVIKKNGVNETIFKTAVDEINQSYGVINDLIQNDTSKIYSRIQDILKQSDSNIIDISSNKLSYTMIEYYSLIAMSCMYGGILAMFVINQNLANMSNKGKRVSVSPTKKSTLVFSGVLASYITQILGILLLFLYTIFVLKVDYGQNLGLVILLALIGSLAGLSLGTGVATLVKSNDNVKSSIILSITMVGSFLAGMMGITMKYVVDTNAPIINKINPVSMITDGLYSLYYYPTLDRYWFDITSLLVFSGLLILISAIQLRRQKYDSI